MKTNSVDCESKETDQESEPEQVQRRRPPCGGLSHLTQSIVGILAAAGFSLVITFCFLADWSFGTQLLVGCSGTMGVLLVVSYLVHWMQVTNKIKMNKLGREMAERQQSKVSTVLSIRALERQTTNYIDNIPMDTTDEYG